MSRNKNGKVTWLMIRDEFKFRYPRFYKKMWHWQPYDISQIVVWLEDGKKFVYDHDYKMGCFLDGNWKTDNPRRVGHIRIDMAEKIRQQLAEPYAKPWYDVHKPSDRN